MAFNLNCLHCLTVLSAISTFLGDSNCQYVLSAKDNKLLSPKALSRSINRIQERLGIPHWTAHDLRRSFCTQLDETLHIDPVVIEKCLEHEMPKIMATYNRNEMLPQRKEALIRWSQYLENLLQENPMTMADWIKKLDGFLTLNDREILAHAGKISHDLAKQFAEQEYELFHQKQIETSAESDSDFEKMIKTTVHTKRDK